MQRDWSNFHLRYVKKYFPSLLSQTFPLQRETKSNTQKFSTRS